MRRSITIATLGLLGLAAPWGCRSDTAPPPATARVPDRDERVISDDGQPVRPLQTAARDDLPPPPFDDAALVGQEAPETPRFIEAYERVGRPRIVVWVAHTPAGYDDESTREIDYAAVETILTDWLSANGKVSIISPGAARQALSPQQAQELNSGHPATTQGIGDRLQADVLVMVRTQITRQSGAGPSAMRLVADSSNLRGGESIGRAVVDVPAPLDKPRLNQYTRYVARKLMADMTNAWSAGGSVPAPQSREPETLPPTSPPPVPVPPPQNQPGPGVDSNQAK